MTAWVLTVVFLAGLVAITAGAWMIAEPAGLIVGGALAVATTWTFRKGLGFDGPTRATD